jgi:hypothetical protein
MQSPPPVSALLQQLELMAVNVRSSLELEDVDWTWRPAVKEWSLTEVMCHLRDVEREVHQERFRALIEKDNPFIQGVSADEWAETRQYKLEDGPKAMNEFLEARASTIVMLDDLDEKTWQREGRHAFFGQTSTHEILSLVVRHDDIHWQQISRLLER